MPNSIVRARWRRAAHRVISISTEKALRLLRINRICRMGEKTRTQHGQLEGQSKTRNCCLSSLRQFFQNEKQAWAM